MLNCSRSASLSIPFWETPGIARRPQYAWCVQLQVLLAMLRVQCAHLFLRALQPVRWRRLILVSGSVDEKKCASLTRALALSAQLSLCRIRMSRKSAQTTRRLDKSLLRSIDWSPTTRPTARYIILAELHRTSGVALRSTLTHSIEHQVTTASLVARQWVSFKSQHSNVSLANAGNSLFLRDNRLVSMRPLVLSTRLVSFA